MARRKPQRRMHWAAYLWPGLPHLWVRGSLAGLTLALAFSVLLNVLILGLLVWPGWLETRLKFACGAAAALLWLAALYETRQELRRLAAEAEEEGADSEATEEPNPNDELLKTAQASYLRGDWPQAERSLRRALRRDRRDPEARLWLATLLQRTGRAKQARRQLARCERLDDAQPLRHEIAAEWALLKPETALAPVEESTPTAQETVPFPDNRDNPGEARRAA